MVVNVVLDERVRVRVHVCTLGIFYLRPSGPVSYCFAHCCVTCTV